MTNTAETFNACNMLPCIQRRANIIARKQGHGIATYICFGDEDKVIDHISYGYRKETTGEYVSNAYRSNFGWKNTYYQPALTTVQLKVGGAA